MLEPNPSNELVLCFAYIDFGVANAAADPYILPNIPLIAAFTEPPEPIIEGLLIRILQSIGHQGPIALARLSGA